MKTTNRFLRLLLPVVAALFFCSVSTAQTLSELTAMQSQLQSFITAATAKTGNPNLPAQDLATLQAQIASVQEKLNTVNAMIQTYSFQQQYTQNEAALTQRQSVENSIAQSDAQLQSAVSAQQALPTVTGSQATQPAQTITTPRDPNYPFNAPLFMSTGNAEQDAALLRQWQQAHPISK